MLQNHTHLRKLSKKKETGSWPAGHLLLWQRKTGDRISATSREVNFLSARMHVSHFMLGHTHTLTHNMMKSRHMVWKREKRQPEGRRGHFNSDHLLPCGLKSTRVERCARFVLFVAFPFPGMDASGSEKAGPRCRRVSSWL